VQEFSEFTFDSLGQIIKLGSDLRLREFWVNEFHLLEFMNEGLFISFLDKGHGNLLLGLLRFEQYLLAVFVIGDDASEHTNGLV